MEVRALALLVTGGMVGAGTRWWLQSLGTLDSFPWQTLTANLIGCAVIGVLSARPVADFHRNRALTAGFCGGLTTLSGFALEVALLRDQGADTRWTYPLVSIAAGLLLVLAGRAIGRRATA